MIKMIKPLITIFAMLKKEGVCVKNKKWQILLDCAEVKINLKKIKPIIYYLLNNFEQKYFIVLQHVPYCLLPEASHHIVYKKNSKFKYFKKSRCKRCKYDLLCPGISEQRYKTLKEFPAAIPDIPEEVVFELTQKCNLKCPLCFRQKKSKDLSWIKVKKTIDQCIKLGIKDLRFTGGEPLLYPDLGKVLRYAKSKGAYVTLNTNATLLNKDNQKILKQYVDNVLISLQGFDSVSENKLTKGKVDFKQKLKNIIYLQQTISLSRVGTIISQTLCRNFNKYFNIIHTLGIKHWELYRPMSQKNILEFKISQNALRSLMNKMKMVREKGSIDLKILNALPFCVTDDCDLSRYVLFGAQRDDGYSRLILDSKGLRPSYSMIKYLGQDIEVAWQSPFLKKLRDLKWVPQQCRLCSDLKWCRGGSRYLARIATGTYFGPDPLMNKKTRINSEKTK